jgi:hypothetical protein
MVLHECGGNAAFVPLDGCAAGGWAGAFGLNQLRGATDFPNAQIFSPPGGTRRLAPAVVEAEFLPGGFVLVKREVYTALREAYPERAVRSGGLYPFDYYTERLEDFEVISEDAAFCRDWRRIERIPAEERDHVRGSRPTPRIGLKPAQSLGSASTSIRTAALAGPFQRVFSTARGSDGIARHNASACRA